MTARAGADLDAVRAAAVDAGLAAGLAEDVAAAALEAASLVPQVPRATSGAGSGIVVGCDLDRTLIYSAAALALPGADADAPSLVVAEVYRGVPLSFLTRDTEMLLGTLAHLATVVPVTTRTLAQCARVRLRGIGGYAVAANGGHLLVDGVPCADWALQVRTRLATGCVPLDEVLAHLTVVSAQPWLLSLRTADNLFAYLVVERAQLPPGFVATLTAWCAERGWTVSLQGRKLYCVPGPLTKTAAFDEVVRRTGAAHTLAAGDSLLDAPLLDAAEIGVRPAHGELHDLDWHRAHVAVTHRSGGLGGQEVVTHLVAAVLADRWARVI